MAGLPVVEGDRHFDQPIGPGLDHDFQDNFSPDRVKFQTIAQGSPEGHEAAGGIAHICDACNHKGGRSGDDLPV